MGEPRPIMSGQPAIPTPKFRVVPGSDGGGFNRFPQRPPMRPGENQFMYSQDSFTRPGGPPIRMVPFPGPGPVRQGIPLQRMPPPMNMNMGMSPRMMMPPPPPQQRPQSSDSEPSEQVNKEKLMRLFKSFCVVCSKYNKANIPNLLSLMDRYIRGQVDVNEFLQNISQFTGLPPQPSLPTFLENNIGLIRGDLESGKLSLDNFLPARLSTNENVSSPQSAHASTSSPQSRPGPSPGPRPTSSGPSPMQKLMNEPPNSEPHPRMTVNYSPLNQPPASAPTFDPNHRNSISESTTASNSPHMFAQPASINPQIPSAGTPGSSSLPSVTVYQTFTPPEKRMKLEGADTSVPPPDPQTNEQKTPLMKPPSTSTAGIAADVAFKEISNEQEDTVEKCIFDRKAFAARLQAKMPECSAFEEQVLTMLSSFMETRVKNMLDKAYEAAEHRLEQLRLNPAYVQKDDPKAQLRVLEKQEKLEQQKKANVEKETILKMSKGKGKDNDMAEKAKKIKKADEEATLNREANEAAIAALGTKKRKFQNPKDSATPSTSQASASRPRVKQVTMRDLIFVFERDDFAASTPLYRKMIYGLIPGSDNNNKQP